MYAEMLVRTNVMPLEIMPRGLRWVIKYMTFPERMLDRTV
jgi:hypothetical protein